MVRSLFNWTFSDIDSFLRENNFKLNYTNGSHHYYVGSVDGKYRQVCVPFHGTKIIKPRTLKGIIIQSGINKKKWLSK